LLSLQCCKGTPVARVVLVVVTAVGHRWLALCWLLSLQCCKGTPVACVVLVVVTAVL